MITNEKLECVELFNNVVLYTEERLTKEDKKILSDNSLYVYEIRSDDTTGMMATIERNVKVNFEASIISRFKILPDNDEIDMYVEYADDILSFIGSELTIDEYVDLVYTKSEEYANYAYNSKENYTSIKISTHGNSVYIYNHLVIASMNELDPKNVLTLTFNQDILSYMNDDKPLSECHMCAVFDDISEWPSEDLLLPWLNQAYKLFEE